MMYIIYEGTMSNITPDLLTALLTKALTLRRGGTVARRQGEELTTWRTTQ
jgi:hypothetical protein